jgi:hypothetical protein
MTIHICMHIYIIYIQKPGESLDKLVELISKSGIFVGYKTNAQYKQAVILFTSNK